MGRARAQVLATHGEAVAAEIVLKRLIGIAPEVPIRLCGGTGDQAMPPLPNTIRPADHPTLGILGGVALVTLGEMSLAVVRTGDASFVALSRSCPHQGAIVDAAGAGFTCPRHGARFSTTGQWVGGRQTTDRRNYPVQYQAKAGTLTIGI